MIRAMLARRDSITPDAREQAAREAASRADLEILRVLFSGDNAQDNGENGLQPRILFKHLVWGDEGEMRIWLNRGADLNHEVKPVLPRDPYFPSPNCLLPGCHDNEEEGGYISTMHLAVGHGSPQILDLLLENGGDINARNYLGETPLHWATYHECHSDMACMILYRGALVDPRCQRGLTPLHVAVLRRNYRGIELLLDAGADIEAKDHDGDTAFKMLASFRPWPYLNYSVLYEGGQFKWVEGHIDEPNGLASNSVELDILLKRGAKTDVLQRLVSLLEWPNAANYQAMEQVCRRLADEGFDFTLPTKKGIPAVYHAAKSCPTEVLQVILQQGAKVHEKFNGLTALHLAAKRFSHAKVNILLQFGACAESRDSKGNTALFKVVTKSDRLSWGCSPPNTAEGIIDMLVAHGADLHTLCGAKKAPVLHYAAFMGDLTIVRYLTCKGARTDVTDRDGRTALDWAKDNKQEAMVYLLTRLSRDQQIQVNSDAQMGRY